MVYLYDNNGVAFLEGNVFDLKIDGSRKIYFKTKDKKSFIWTGHLCPPEMLIDEKKEYLDKYNQLLESQYYKEQEQKNKSY